MVFILNFLIRCIFDQGYLEEWDWEQESQLRLPIIYSPEHDIEMMNFGFLVFSRLLMIFQYGQLYSTPQIPGVSEIYIYF